MALQFVVGSFTANAGDLPHGVSGTASDILLSSNRPFLKEDVYLGTIWMFFDTLASTPTTLTWALSRDGAGEQFITPPETVVFDGTVNGATVDYTSGAVGGGGTECTIIRNIYATVPKALDASSNLYLWLATDTGTMDLIDVVIGTELNR